MKLIYKYIACLLILTVAGFMNSCSDMNELSDRFLDDGEIVYAARVNDALVAPGEGRARIMLLIDSYRIETVRVYWNNYADSIDIHVGNDAGLMAPSLLAKLIEINEYYQYFIQLIEAGDLRAFEYTIENLPEGDYLFHMVSFDKFGNKSLPGELSGAVFGSNYQNGLRNRPINTLYLEETDLKVFWGTLLTGIVGMEVTYTNTDDEVVTDTIPGTEQQSVFANYAKDFSYRTIFQPDILCIDSFYTDFNSVKVELKKIKGITTQDSYASSIKDMDDMGSYGAGKAVDGNPDTFWQSKAGASYPHSIFFDLGARYDVAKVELTTPSAINNFADFIIQGSTNRIAWNPKEVPTPEPPVLLRFANTTGPQAFYPEDINARYLRIFMINGAKDFAQLSEITVYERIK